MDFCGHFLTSISWSVSDQNLRPLSDAEAARKRHFVRQKANNRGANICPLVRQKANTRGVNIWPLVVLELVCFGAAYLIRNCFELAWDGLTFGRVGLE
jgi:hypothetical protein